MILPPDVGSPRLRKRHPRATVMRETCHEVRAESSQSTKDDLLEVYELHICPTTRTSSRRKPFDGDFNSSFQQAFVRWFTAILSPYAYRWLGRTTNRSNIDGMVTARPRQIPATTNA